MDKQDLRRRMKDVLQYRVERDDKAVAKRIFHFLNTHFHKDCIVGGYVPLLEEPDWRVDCQHHDFCWAFPRPKPATHTMEYAKCRVDELVKRKAFGTVIGIPPVESEVVVPEVLLVPGLAFGRNGERLGRGGGFFDRYISQYEGTLIGVCFEIQLLDNLPMQDHDCWMDYVITERDLYLQDHS